MTTLRVRWQLHQRRKWWSSATLGVETPNGERTAFLFVFFSLLPVLNAHLQNSRRRNSQNTGIETTEPKTVN
jgi:hypothetical protein